MATLKEAQTPIACNGVSTMKAANFGLPFSVKPKGRAEYLAYCARITGADLPVIITELGEYRTRDGNKVIIDRIDTLDLASFNCKGLLIKPKRRGSGVTRIYQTWQPNGRNIGLGESNIDIVAKL